MEPEAAKPEAVEQIGEPTIAQGEDEVDHNKPSRKKHLTHHNSLFMGRQELSSGLNEIDQTTPSVQVDFWSSCVVKKMAELDALGGLPIDSVYNDVLTRYFDSSFRGLQLVFKSALRDQAVRGKDELDKDGLFDALSEHYHFFEPVYDDEEKKKILEEKTIPEFERICDIISLPCGIDAFGYVVRRLRMALLVQHFQLHHFGDSIMGHGKVYHMDYDDDHIWTPYSPHQETRKVTFGGKTFAIPIVENQVPLGNYGEYLFTSKMARKGRVHWTHLHTPSTELILAVGQVWRLTGPDIALLCNLKGAQPQVSLHEDGTGKHGRVDDKHGYDWSSMIMPGIYLDRTSRESLHLYRDWFGRRQDPSLRKTVGEDPPRIRVAVTHTTLSMMWTSCEAGTAITMCSDPLYIGKWITDAAETPDTMKFVRWLWDKVTCAGMCVRAKKAEKEVEEHDEERQALLQTPRMQIEKSFGRNSEAGVTISDELRDVLEGNDVEHGMMGEIALNKKESRITFERCFEMVLACLERQNSMLRLGNHYQLLMRIMSNRSAEYLEVLEVYSAAIKRLSHLLRADATRNKDELVKKIELVKLELATLQTLVKPFGEFVVPEICRISDSFHDYPLVLHHLRDTQNNIRTFMPKVDSLIDLCTNLTNEYDRNAGDKMNSILNILTFITFVITPMQLMTGIYGMNFKVMPELQWDKGYSHYFWGVAMTMSILFAMILVCLKR